MSWWHYLLLVNFYLVLFFGFYALLLRRETFFQLNRVYLVAASLLSFFIPLVQAEWVQRLFITQEVQQTIYSGPIAMVYNFTPADTDNALTLGQILNAAYITITVCLVIRLLWQLLILKKAIETPSPSAAYSFFKKISLGKNIAKSEIINAHEQVHARQWHSVDVLIIELVMIINWFNPVVYLYRFAIKYIHEFIADRQVIQAGTDKADYALLLLSQTFDVPSHQLVNPFFNHSLLKQRIMMLQKNRSQRIALVKYGLSAPLFMLMLIFSSATVNNSKAVNTINKKAEKALMAPAADVFTIITDHSAISYKKNSPQAVTDTVPKDNKIFNQVETPPEFTGGMDGFSKFLAKNLRYPAVDRASKTEGHVIVTFVVEKDGTLSEIKGLRSPSETLTKEAIRVLLLSPKWKPGIQNGYVVRVLYTVPINFSLNTAQAPITGSVITSDDKGPVFSQVEKQPMFPGGTDAFSKFLSANVHFPASDREAGIFGRVILSFIVEQDGSLTNFKVLRTPSVTMGDEAIRALSLSPKWVPGNQNGHPVRVLYTIPVSFTLGVDDEKHEKKAGITVDSLLKSLGPTSPLYIVDGVELKPANISPLSTIPQESITSMEILKDETAIALYGDKGKYGVILITTKNAKTKP